jgi:hypothetical protein
VFSSERQVASAVSGAGNFHIAKEDVHVFKDEDFLPTASLLSQQQGTVRTATGLLPVSLPLNGNFEDGVEGNLPTYWGQTYSIPAVISTEEAHNGTKSLKLESDHEIVSGWAADACFEIEAGVRYVLSFWAKATTPDAGLLTMFPVYSNFANTAFRRALLTSDNAFQMFHTIPVMNGTGTGWEKFSHEFTAAEESSKVRLLIGCTGGTIYLDDLSFQEECADTLNVYGAEATQASSMGTYTRLSKDKSGLPIYSNANGQYLYFWGDFDSWLIGPDYHSEAAVIQSPNSFSQGCPTTVSGMTWSVQQPDAGSGTFKWVSLPMTLERVAR